MNRSVYLLCLFGMLTLTGCATVRREQAPEHMINAATPLGFRPDIRYVSTDPQAIKSRFSEMLQRRRGISKNAPLNILALSGGGAGGSFGAGALVGFSRQGSRPLFDIVTGVSAGALIAPFAFLGAGWDAQLTDNFSGANSDHFLLLQGIDMLFKPGIYQREPLIKFVDQFVTDGMLKEVAAQAALGRLLLVATTDLDKEETVIWDMGQIAAQGGETARVLFRDVLVASASIPGVFPPTIIPVENAGKRYDEMHIDASATVPFFIAPALAYVMPLDPKALKGANVYVLINGQLGGIPHTTDIDTISILSRSFSAALNHMARTEIALTSEFSRRYGMTLKVSEVPIGYPFRGPLYFHEAALRELFSYGAVCAEQGKLWNSVAKALDHGDKAPAVEPEPSTSVKPSVPSCPSED